MKFPWLWRPRSARVRDPGDSSQSGPAMPPQTVHGGIGYDTASAAMHIPARANPWAMPQIPRGVIPNGIAMDECSITDYYGGYCGENGEGIGFLGYPRLAELSQRPEYRKISETIAREMTRRWIRIVSKGDGDKTDKIAKLENEIERLKIRREFRKAAELDGFFGRGHIYIDTGKTDDPDLLKTPLIIDKRTIKKGDLKRVRAIEPVWTYPQDYNSRDPLAADYFRPHNWFVMGKLVHSTRLLTFVSREMPDLLKPTYAFGGLSMSQMAMPYIENWLTTRQSVSDAIHQYAVSGIKTDLSDILAPGGAQNIAKKAAFMQQCRDNRNLLLLDNGRVNPEEYFNSATPITGLADLQAQSQEQMASVTSIPLVILLGITPSGLNASSEGEIRVFYDFISSMQELIFSDNLRNLFEIVQLSTFGDIDQDLDFEFMPLWQIDDVAKAAMQKTIADTHAEYVAMGAISNEEVRLSLAGDQQSPYQGLDMNTPPPEMEPEENAGEFEPDAKGANPASGKTGEGWGG